ncbi:hypothetical protein Franean1_5016 [Parafrankia sp. EAN1pec]|uniref:hypothetical protein n=1 Tax=Parafrankia sp. (strain EAN1pec) TaxID=298653 RepID=UPI00005417E4|nr:hypothetical protein Franean1_5016 [Frankia sp. EAN1pec]
MAGSEDELTALVAAVNSAREREDEVRRVAHLDYCRAIRELVGYEERAHGQRGAKSRAARHLGMSAQNVGIMLDQLHEAETGAPRPKQVRSARGDESVTAGHAEVGS